MRKARVGVLTGGDVLERDVSIASARAVEDGLSQIGYEVFPLVANSDDNWLADLTLKNPDVIFIAHHGREAEQGLIQSLLRQMEIAYTGSDVLASALTANKLLAANLFTFHEIKTPNFRVIEDFAAPPSLGGINFPVIVKPLDRGLSLGVSLVRREEELRSAIEKARSFSRSIIVQEYIPGREFTCSVIDDLTDVVPLPPTEVIVKSNGILDYQAKTTPGIFEEVVPAFLSEEDRDLIQEISVLLHKAAGASGASKTDLKLTESGEIYVLEINTLPLMSPQTSLPLAAAAHGLSFPELCERMVEAALRRHALKV